MNREQLKRKYRHLWWDAPNDSEQEDAYGDVWYTIVNKLPETWKQWAQEQIDLGWCTAIFQGFLDDVNKEEPGITVTQLREKYRDRYDAAPAHSREEKAYRDIRVLLRWSPRSAWAKNASEQIHAGACSWVYQEFLADVEALEAEEKS